MLKLMTLAALKGRKDLLKKDKSLIEKIVGELRYPQDLPDSIESQAICGYLVQEMDENIIDEKLREELSGDACAFSDGWSAAFEYLKGER